MFWKQADVAIMLIATRNKSIVPDIAPMLTSEDRHIRCNAGWVLAGLGDERGLPVVLAELTDKSDPPTERLTSDGRRDVAGQIREDHYYAAWVLEKIGDRRAVPALINSLEDPDINYEAAIVLAHLGDQRAVPALLAALDRAKGGRPASLNVDMKFWAAYGLLAFRHPLGLQTLAAFLKSDDQRKGMWRAWAADGLAVIGTEDDVPILKKLAASDPFQRDCGGCVAPPGGQNTYFPVREAAQRAILRIDTRPGRPP